MHVGDGFGLRLAVEEFRDRGDRRYPREPAMDFLRIARGPDACNLLRVGLEAASCEEGE